MHLLERSSALGSRAIFTRSFAVLLVRTMGLACGFFFNVIIARLLGPAGAGVYYLALASATAATVFGRLGMDNAILKFVSSAWTNKDRESAAGVVRVAVRVGLGASAVATVLLLLLAPWLSNVLFSKPNLTPALQIISAAVVPLSLLNLFGEALRGMRRALVAAAAQSLLVPALSVVVLLIAMTWVDGPESVAVVYVIAVTAAFGASLTLLVRWLPLQSGDFALQEVLRTSMPLFWVSVMSLLMSWSDLVMIGIWGDSSAVGLYGAAVRTASMVSFFLIAVNSIAAPEFAALHRQGRRVELEDLAQRSTLITVMVALPLVVAIVCFPSEVLRIFGPEFVRAAPALVVLALGQFVNAATGSVGYLLMMTGHERLMRNNIIFASVLGVVLNVLLIPRLGILGASLGTAVSLVLMNVTSAVLVWMKLDIVTVPQFRRRPAG